MSRSLRAALEGQLKAEAFAAPGESSSAPRRIGAEVELIPVEPVNGWRCPLEPDGALPGTLPFLRRFGSRQGWRETLTAKSTPCFELPAGGTLTFEPGGQLEYSSPPCRSAGALLHLLKAVIQPLRSAASSEGIELLAVGIDPFNGPERAALLLPTKRYARMADYLARVGPAGAMMMRQTAAFQIGLDLDGEASLRWTVLNAATPYFTAIFANSPVYDGFVTGFRSTRAEVWRTLDPARTGLPWSDRAPVRAYLDFALRAPALLLPQMGGEHRPFEDWLLHAQPTMEEWRDHLTTLFPEVRPRGHFELRSCDAVPPQWYAAPIALAVGITYDARSLHTAADLLGRPDLGLLQRAGRVGLADPLIGRTAVDLVDVALAGCEALGPGYFPAADLEQARGFFDQYTRAGLSPADDLVGAEVAA